MQSLKSHARRWGQCEDCHLGCLSTTANHVLYDGVAPAKVLFIGEAPGDSENMLGIPFIGKVGKILRQMLKEVPTLSYCITNTIACFPPNEVGHFREPNKQEALSCAPRVVELFRLCKPKLVVLLGRIAVKFLPEEIKESGVNILELKHPGFIARNGGIGSAEYKRNLHKLRRAYNAITEKRATKKFTKDPSTR